MKILIADDHPVFRKGLVDIIQEAFPDSEIFEAKNGQEAGKNILSQSPVIAILDVEMPIKNGVEVCREIKEKKSLTKVVILTMYKKLEIYNMALSAGCEGFLLKESSQSEIIKSIDVILNKNECFVSESMIRYVNEYERKNKTQQGFISGIQKLTKTEKKVLEFVSKNMSNKEIALRLFVTPKSIENYRYRICKKLNLQNGTHSLIKWTVENRDLVQFLLY